MLPPEQVEQIKHQIIQQIDSNFPEDKKESAKQQINSMNAEQLEEFLEKNKLIKTQTPQGEGGRGDAEGAPQNQQCIFCSIISGDVQSYKIDENDKAIAILEINPISKGHAIIIPKEHIPDAKSIPKEAKTLANQVAKKIKTTLKPKDAQLFSANLFGHQIINILPVYNNETPESKRNQAKPEELQSLQKLFEEKPKPIKKPKTEKIKADKKIWLPKRIP